MLIWAILWHLHPQVALSHSSLTGRIDPQKNASLFQPCQGAERRKGPPRSF